MVKIIVSGACGRMGKRIIALAREDARIKIVGALENKTHTSIGKDVGEVLGLGKINVSVEANLDKVIKKGEVIIEFTNPETTMEHLAVAGQSNKAMVIGTTGLNDDAVKEIKQAAGKIPIVIAPNMSAGVNLLFALVGDIAKKLGPDFDIEIMETHHRFKKDAPSGTAKRLAENIAAARGRKLKDIVVYGREGIPGERPKGEIGIHAIRAGDVVGEHTVVFAAKGERIELTHRAHSRDTFAQGALRAAKFIVNKSAKLYDMQDVLNETENQKI